MTKKKEKFVSVTELETSVPKIDTVEDLDALKNLLSEDEDEEEEMLPASVGSATNLVLEAIESVAGRIALGESNILFPEYLVSLATVLQSLSLLVAEEKE